MQLGQPWVNAGFSVVAAPFIALAVNRTRRTNVSPNDELAYIAPLGAGVSAWIASGLLVWLGVADFGFWENLMLAMLVWGGAFCAAGIVMKKGARETLP